MGTNERDRYYHGGAGAENRRNWDRSSRDGDYGRDYENRFRTDRDRNREYYSHHHDPEEKSYNVNDQRERNYNTGRQQHNFRDRGSDADRYANTVDNVEQRMRYDRARLQQQGYGSGQMSGYSGSAFGGSNYSSHGDFGGSNAYGAMSGGGGNTDDYISMSGYGGDRGNISNNRDRGTPNYGNRNYTQRFDNGNYSSGRGNKLTISHYSPDNQAGSYSGFGKFGTTGDERYENRNFYQYERNHHNPDRGGYSDYDPNTY